MRESRKSGSVRARGEIPWAYSAKAAIHVERRVGRSKVWIVHNSDIRGSVLILPAAPPETDLRRSAHTLP